MMTAPVDLLFPPLPTGQVPYWRLVLRGCSQLCFQTNELTGLLFLAGALVASPIAFAYMLVAATIAPGGRMLLGDRGAVLETGLPGLNPCLIALSLPAFFQTGWTDGAMWAVLIVAVACCILLTRLFLIILPFPFLALPFLIVFWVLYTLQPELSFIRPAALEAADPGVFHPLTSLLYSLGQAIFSASMWSGLLFVCGMFLSNWRHGLLAVLGAVIGSIVSYYHGEMDLTGVNLGLYGFNGVLAAVSVAVFCGGLRLAVLGALLATMLMPAIAAFGVPTLSAPFVFTTWLVLALGWIERQWFVPPQPAPTSKTAGASPPAQHPFGG